MGNTKLENNWGNIHGIVREKTKGIIRGIFKEYLGEHSRVNRVVTEGIIWEILRESFREYSDNTQGIIREYSEYSGNNCRNTDDLVLLLGASLYSFELKKKTYMGSKKCHFWYCRGEEFGSS